MKTTLIFAAMAIVGTTQNAAALELRNVRDATVYCHAVVRYIDSESDVDFSGLLFYAKPGFRGVHIETGHVIFPAGFRVRSLTPTTVRYECATKRRA